MNYGIQNDLEGFLKDISNNINSEVIKTPWKNLNEKLNGGLYPGLYTIGAISSLGKTAFTLQLADYIAENGDNVLFFSVEMPKKEMFARSISRTAFLDNPKENKNVSTTEVLKGMHDLNKFQEYTLNYFKKHEKLHIFEGTFNTSVISIEKDIDLFIQSQNSEKHNNMLEKQKEFETEILQKKEKLKLEYMKKNNLDLTKKLHEKQVNEYLEILEEPIKKKIESNRKILESEFNENIDIKPVVFVDYLQILEHGLKDNKGNVRYLNDKQAMDFITKALKQISRKYDLIMIVVSSFNRQSYKNKVSHDCFKESGVIEYTSDVLAGLQLTILDKDNKSNDKDIGDLINKAKEKLEREVTLVILKQRNGKAFVKQDFIFRPVNNLYEEVSENKNNNKRGVI